MPVFMAFSRPTFSVNDERGSALAEFAILTPSLMILIFYSVFFTDLAEVKLKTLEAARFATWESVVYRDPATVNQEIQERFINLRSTDLGEASTIHMIGVQDLKIVTTLDDQLEVDMTGGAVPPPEGGSSGGSLSLGSIDQAINTVIGWARLPSQGRARSDVTFSVANKIIPSFMMLGTEIRATSDESEGLSSSDGFSFQTHHVLVYDTWKAWPNKNRRVGATNAQGAAPAQTYEIAEQAISDQVEAMAFVKLSGTSFSGSIQQGFDFFSLPYPFAADRAPGPTFVKAPESTNGVLSFSPTYGRADTQRWGHRYAASPFLGDNPNPGMDRSRWSLPYTFSKGQTGGKTISWWHQKAGGMITMTRPNSVTSSPPNAKLLAHQYKNDYYLSYQCRGHYYDGMIVDAGEIGDYRNFDGCGDNVDTVQGGAQNLLDQFGSGLQLPGF